MYRLAADDVDEVGLGDDADEGTEDEAEATKSPMAEDRNEEADGSDSSRLRPVIEPNE